MPKKDSPKGGPYILTGVSFRRSDGEGGWEKFEQGDEVTLTDQEAARLLSGQHKSFRPKTKDDNDTSDSDTPKDTDPSSRGTTPVSANSGSK